MQKIDVFISRKSADAPYAQKLYEYLTTQGLSVFESDHTLKELGQADYTKAIDDALVSTTHMIVVASSAAHIQSSWVESEWSFFLNRKRSGKTSGNLFTVITKDMSLEDVPPRLANYEVIPYNEQNFPIIYNYVRQPNTPAKPAPAKPLAAVKPHQWLWGVVGVLVLGLLLGVVYWRSQPVDVTVFTQPEPALRLSPQYPAFKEGDLSLFIGNKEEKKHILANEEAIFKQIPTTFLGEKVAVQLHAKYWRVAQDSVVLDKTMRLSLIPDGGLGTIVGNVKDTQGHALSNVSIGIDSDTTLPADTQGNFLFTLPLKMQKESYKLQFQKAGYQPLSEYYYPQSGIIEVRLKPN